MWLQEDRQAALPRQADRDARVLLDPCAVALEEKLGIAEATLKERRRDRHVCDTEANQRVEALPRVDRLEVAREAARWSKLAPR